MAVLVEGISVVMRIKTVEDLYPGGFPAFCSHVPDNTLCFDEEIAGIAFMTPQDAGAFIGHLETHSFTFQIDGKAKDIAVMDQYKGATMFCNWLECTKLSLRETRETTQTGECEPHVVGKARCCWLFEGPRDRGH